MTDFASHFDRLYQSNPDPWNYAASPYEAAKYDATCAALQSGRYRSGIEIGCSVGVLSARLAARCERFLAIDLAERAVVSASARLLPFPGAEAKVACIPVDWPEGPFDLIMLSEVIYYLQETEIALLAAKVSDSGMRRCECVLVNWRGHTDTHFTGNQARLAFCTALRRHRDFAEIAQPGTPDYDHVTLMLA